MADAVGILAYGSLIDDPGAEIEPLSFSPPLSQSRYHLAQKPQ
jgi:hypothetical protein